jgi:DNA-binding MarR family transcriptional regulator
VHTSDATAVHGVTDGIRILVTGADQCRRRIAVELDVGLSELLALGYLHAEGPVTPSELSGAIGLTSGSITALMDRLERMGYAKRNPHPEDRRSYLVCLTPSGKRAMSWVYAKTEACISEALDGLSRPDLAELSKTLADLGQALGGVKL